MRWLVRVGALALLVACARGNDLSRPLPAVGPFAAIERITLGTTAERVLAVRERAARAPMGGVREPMGEWILHYDMPTPRVDTLFATMRVRELTALRGLPDSGAAQQLQDSLLSAIRVSGGPLASSSRRCTRAARGLDSVTWTVIADKERELVLGYWVSAVTSPIDTFATRDSTRRRVTPPLMLAMTLRVAGESRAWEREVDCPASARD